MGFKTITIKEDVYNKLIRAKPKNESFSEFFEKKVTEESVEERTKRIMKYAGMWKDMPEKEFNEIKKRMKKYKEEFNRDSEERMKRLWGDDYS